MADANNGAPPNPDGETNGNGEGTGGGGLGSIFDSATVINPASLSNSGGGNENGSDPGDTAKGKRGRPRGSKNRAKETAAARNLDLAGVEKLLLLIHAALAGLTACPELALSEEEAKAMAEATGKLSRHYPILEKINDSTIDHANFVTTFGYAYFTRFVAIKARRTAERARPAPPTNVVIMPNAATDRNAP